MTPQEFDEIVKATCPHCQKNLAARQRLDTKEWVHDFAPTGANFGRQGHTLCLATHLRNSKLNPPASLPTVSAAPGDIDRG